MLCPDPARRREAGPRRPPTSVEYPSYLALGTGPGRRLDRITALPQHPDQRKATPRDGRSNTGACRTRLPTRQPGHRHTWTVNQELLSGSAAAPGQSSVRRIIRANVAFEAVLRVAAVLEEILAWRPFDGRLN